MIDYPDTLLDLTDYRHIAGYVLALQLLRRGQHTGTLRMKLRSPRDADWLAARLQGQGYDQLSVEARDGEAVLQIHHSKAKS